MLINRNGSQQAQRLYIRGDMALICDPITPNNTIYTSCKTLKQKPLEVTDITGHNKGMKKCYINDSLLIAH